MFLWFVGLGCVGGLFDFDVCFVLYVVIVVVCCATFVRVVCFVCVCLRVCFGLFCVAVVGWVCVMLLFL